MNADPNAIDLAALSPYLAANVPGFGVASTIRKFDTGQSNPTYLIETAGGERYVLRAKPPGQLLKSAHQVDREYRVMKALAPTGVPVPEVLFLSPEETPIGRMFYLMRFVEGRILWDPALPDLDAEERGAIYDAMNRTLAALHDVDTDAVGLSDFGKPGSYFERQLGRWTSQYRASETQMVADMDRLIDWLEQNQPADDGVIALVHGDYRLDNMIFATDRPEVLAVLDWELSTLGHPYADLAYQCMQWRLPNSSAFRGLGGIDRRAAGLPSEQEYVELYCQRRGITSIGHWTFYLAFSFFRLAAICQGVYKRALDGNASNPEKARRYGEAVTLLAGLAVQRIEGGK